MCIGEAPSSESYLNIPNIISAALSRGVEAIHPVCVSVFLLLRVSLVVRRVWVHGCMEMDRVHVPVVLTCCVVLW